MESVFNLLNQSTFFNGCIMFIMNIGGKYLVKDIPDSMDYYFNTYSIFRYLVVFSIAFISTRNVKMSILLTLLFILIFKFLIDTRSKFCLIRNKQLTLDKSSNEEYQKALEIIKKYHSQ